MTSFLMHPVVWLKATYADQTGGRSTAKTQP
jgi:hypothetical protein